MKGLARTFFLICCLLSAGVCTLQLHDRINYYFKTPIMTQVNITQADAGRFPPITICPAYFKLGFTRIIKYGLMEVCMENKYCDEIVARNYKRLEMFPLNEMNFSVKDIWQEGGIDDSLVNVAVSCAGIADKSICVSKKDVDLIVYPTDTLSGRCMTYVLENDVEYNGASTYLLFNVTDHQFLNEEDESADIFYFTPLTMRTVAIQAYYSGKELIKNHQNDIVISSKKFEFLDLKHRPCKDEETVINCKIKCFTEKFEQLLHCSLPFVNSTILKPCKTGQSIAEAYNDAAFVYRTMRHDECQCNQMCTEVVYDSVVDVAPMSEETGNRTLFTLYFFDSNVEVITEAYMYTFPALLSDIAGNVGFFLGLSVLRALHVLVHLFTYVTHFHNRKSNVK